MSGRVRALLGSAALLGAALAPSAASAAGRAPACYFAASARRADMVTAAGQRVELFDHGVRVDGRLLDRCDGLPADHPVAIAPFGDGFAIAFRDEGVKIWSAGEFRPLPGLPPLAARSLAAAGGALFIGTVDDGLYRFAEGAAARVGARSIGRATITALFAESANRVHVGADPGGWWTIEGDAEPKKRRARIDFVGCFRAAGRGIVALPPGPACEDGVRAEGLPSDHVTALATREGELFVGTFDRGVFTLNEEGDARALEGAPRHVNALLAARGALFIGATSGLYRAEATGPAERVALDLPDPHVNGLAVARGGALWMATTHGLIGWANGRTRILDERRGLPSSLVYAVAEAADGALWAGTARGAARIDGARIDVFNTDNGKLPHDWVTALLPDGDGVDVGTYNAGVTRLDARGASAPLAAFGRTWVNPHGLARIARGLVAATMGDGLRAAEGGPADRLPSGDVTAVVEHRGALWVGTRAGIARLPLAPRP